MKLKQLRFYKFAASGVMQEKDAETHVRNRLTRRADSPLGGRFVDHFRDVRRGFGKKS